MSYEYDAYLNKHVKAVERAARWMVDNLPELGLTEGERDLLIEHAANHDASKYSRAEYPAYDGHFYGVDDNDAFSRAWLHHIHHNPHHWQHWVIVNGYGKFSEPGVVTALEMPKVYVLEMIADWWSFSWLSGNLYEVFDWYEGHRCKIVLNRDTKEYVEDVLGRIREVLDDACH